VLRELQVAAGHAPCSGKARCPTSWAEPGFAFINPNYECKSKNHGAKPARRRQQCLPPGCPQGSAGEKCCVITCHLSPPKPQQRLILAWNLALSTKLLANKPAGWSALCSWLGVFRSHFPLEAVLSLKASCTFALSYSHWHLSICFFPQKVINRERFGSKPFTCHMGSLCFSSLLCHFCLQLARQIQSKSSAWCSSTAFGEHSYIQH